MPTKSAESETVLSLLGDPWWRLRNLYHIKSEESGQIIPFAPYPEQESVFRAILDDGFQRLIIPKARRRGMSTGIDILMLDRALFSAGFEGGIVDRNQSEATKKLFNTIKTSVERLPAFLLDDIRRIKDNDDQLTFQAGKDAASSIYASTGYRGGNCNFLHVSEWGWIQCADPKRSEEIQTGAIQAARKGTIVVETTWKGGKRGHLWEYTKSALETADEDKHARSWRVMFFPWHTDPAYSIDSTNSRILPEVEDYFQEIEALHGIVCTDGQKRWYQEEAWPLVNNRFGEYPSTLDECFKSPMDGVIYEAEMARAIAERRVTSIPVERGLPVFVAFDIGRNDAMPLAFIQPVGKELRVVGYYVNHRESARHYGDVIKAWMAEKGVEDIRILLPHDGNRKSMESGLTLVDVFREMGFRNVQHVPKITSVWAGINYVRDTFPYFWFDKDTLQKRFSRGSKEFPSLGECLDNYHQAESSSGMMVSVEPIHDDFSHGCLNRGMLVATARGLVAIENVRVGDMVVTPTGLHPCTASGSTGVKPVYQYTFSDGSTIECTEEHPFFTDKGLQPIGDVLRNAASCTSIMKGSGITAAPMAISKRPTDLVRSMGSANSTGSFGRTLTDLFRRTFTSITLTAIRRTTRWITSRGCPKGDMSASTLPSVGNANRQRKARANIVARGSRSEARGFHSIVPEHATATTLWGLTQPSTPGDAKSVMGSLPPRTSQEQNTVPSDAEPSVAKWGACPQETPKISDYSRLATSRRNALCAALSSPQTNDLHGSALRGVNPVHVVSSKYLGDLEVFNISVAKDFCYYANGFLTSNCDALRTFAEGWQKGLINRAASRTSPDLSFDDEIGSTGRSFLAGGAKWRRR